MVVIAAWQAGWAKTASFVNACLIFSVVSQANSSLYAASRTMYGMTREMPKTNWFLKKLRFLSLVERFTHVPVWALVVTALSFIWLPFLSFPTGFAIADVSPRS
jgi:amino acid transporter